MAKKKTGLGRGLTALLANSDVDAMIEPESDDELRVIDVEDPTAPRQIGIVETRATGVDVCTVDEAIAFLLAMSVLILFFPG